MRLLVLGESHWSSNVSSPDRGLTRRVVNDTLSGEAHQGFFSRAAKVAEDGFDGSMASMQVFWSHVAFYHFVQEYAGTAPRQRPRDEAWALAAPAFRDVLASLRPHLILVCGRTLWDRVKREDGLSEAPLVDSWDAKIRSRDFIGSDAWRAVGGTINHPASWGFKPLEWQPRFAAYRTRAVRMLACIASDESRSSASATA